MKNSTVNERQKPSKRGFLKRVVRRRSSTSVRWVMRFAGSGVCDVIRRGPHGNIIWVVRVCGYVVDSKPAKAYALDFRAGKRLPDYIQAYGDIPANGGDERPDKRNGGNAE